MLEIRTVLCPVDFSDATERQFHFAVDLCRLFGARLVLHHNLGNVGPGAAVGWMWFESHDGPPSERSAEDRLRRVLSQVPSGVACEARLTHGTPSHTVMRVAEIVHADLLLLTTHGESHEEHMSVTEQVLERSLASVLALHDASVDHGVPRFGVAGPVAQSLLVPTSFSGTSTAAVGFAFSLADRLPLDVHLLHIEPSRAHVDEPTTALAGEDRSRLHAMVPAQHAERTRIHVTAGDPSQEIPAVAERVGASLIVMGEHTRAPLRRWFSRDTGRAVLHHAHCPVWYVPGGR